MKPDKQYSYPTLSRSQARAIEELEDTFKRIEQWDGASREEIEQDKETFDLCLKDYKNAIIRAIRVGFNDHHVKEFVAVQQALGQWDTLRRARSGLEKGVKRPMSWADLWVWSEADRLLGLGKRPEAIRCALVNKLANEPPPKGFSREEAIIQSQRLRKMSRQGFHKLLKRLDIRTPLA